MRLVSAARTVARMGAWPLINRELKGMSRQGQIYWIRVIGGGLGILSLALLLLRDVEIGAALGARMFQVLNWSLSFTILLVGPVITADCIAVEKREGTLGLLFLAPLTPRDIVLAKAITNAIRAFTLFLAVAPMMALPVVFGGVQISWLISGVFWHLSALCIALSAGILASTLHREFIQAAVWAVLYCLAFVIGCYFVSLIAWPFLAFGFRSAFLLPIAMVVSQAWILGSGILIMWVVLRYACRKLKGRWEKESQDFNPPFWVRLFSDSELWREIFKWDTQKARSAHPIAWLQEYSWTARLAKWGWCALALVGILFAVGTGISSSRYHMGHLVLSAVVVLGIALAGANSFRTERLSGAIELLLVTPLTPLKIIGGRLWGIWVHFLPAVAIIAFTWVSSAPLMKIRSVDAALLVSSYLFVPAIGLYLSMFPWNVLVAWVTIYGVGAVAPYIAGMSLGDALYLGANERVAIIILLQAILGIIALALLWKKLERRSFVFQQYQP